MTTSSNRPASRTAARRLWRVVVVIAPPGLTPAGMPERAAHPRRSHATQHPPNWRAIAVATMHWDLFIPRPCCLRIWGHNTCALHGVDTSSDEVVAGLLTSANVPLRGSAGRLKV